MQGAGELLLSSDSSTCLLLLHKSGAHEHQGSGCGKIGGGARQRERQSDDLHGPHTNHARAPCAHVRCCARSFVLCTDLCFHETPCAAKPFFLQQAGVIGSRVQSEGNYSVVLAVIWSSVNFMLRQSDCS